MVEFCEPPLYLQTKRVACEALEDLRCISRQPLLLEEERFRARRDLAVLVRHLYSRLCFPALPSAAPSSTLTPLTDSTQPEFTSITSVPETVDELEPAALAAEVLWWGRDGGFWNPVGDFRQEFPPAMTMLFEAC